MKYILAPFGVASVDEASSVYADIMARPEASRPTFLLETDSRVVAYLARLSALSQPKEVTMRQARLALLGAGLLPTVELAIAAMTGTAGDAARIEWEYSNSLKRSQPLVTQLGAGLGLTVGQLDALFLTASTL
jgi:hypothetical protein